MTNSSGDTDNPRRFGRGKPKASTTPDDDQVRRLDEFLAAYREEILAEMARGRKAPSEVHAVAHIHSKRITNSSRVAPAFLRPLDPLTETDT